MIKNDIALAIEKNSGFNSAKSLLIVEAVLESLKDALSKGEKVEIRGFGSFSLNHRQQRQGRNPKTGQVVLVPAKSSPHFKASKDLRARVDIRP